MIKAKIQRGSGLVVKVKLRGYPPNVAVEFTGIARYERSLTEDGHG